MTLSRSYRSITGELVAVKTRIQSAEEMAASAALEIAALRAELARDRETETRAARFQVQRDTAPVAPQAAPVQAEPAAEERPQ